MHSSIYKLIIFHTCYSQIHKTLPKIKCTCYLPALSQGPGSRLLQLRVKLLQTNDQGVQSPTVNIDVICTRLQIHLNKIAISFTQDINISTSSTQNINVINIRKCHSHKLLMSSTHDFNVIHTRYQCYPHKMSIINTKYQCH